MALLSGSAHIRKYALEIAFSKFLFFKKLNQKVENSNFRFFEKKYIKKFFCPRNNIFFSKKGSKSKGGTLYFFFRISIGILKQFLKNEFARSRAEKVN